MTNKHEKRLQGAAVGVRAIRLDKFSARELGFPGLRNDGDGDFTRFIARWRLAANFSAVEINGFSPKIVDGYAGILKLVLTVHAAEQFVRSLGKRKAPMGHLKKALGDSLPVIGWTKSADRLCQMLRSHLDGEDLKMRIEECLRDKKIDVFAVAFGVRHLFSHGVLTASANNADPATVGRLCRKLAGIILNSLEEHFSKAVEERCGQNCV
jgi:hypothetical protein